MPYQLGFTAGDLIDHFKIVRLLGKGGMGEVYLARDTKLGRRVALKFVLPDALGDNDAVERFLHEAQVTAQFNHQHIITIHAVGSHRQTPYVALEFLEGATLRERMNGDPLGPREIIRIGKAIAEALQESHRHGVLHRDLKPENVIVPRDGRLRVLDFGLAKRVSLHNTPRLFQNQDQANEVSDISDQTETIQQKNKSYESAEGLAGTPLYMSPEQWKQQEITPAVDIWALGLLLWEMTSGEHPFHTATQEHVDPLPLFTKVCAPTPAPDLAGNLQLPEGFGDIVAKMLEKEASNRPAARDVVRRLDKILASYQGPFLQEDECPFRGLLPFTEINAPFFFGRDADIAETVELLRDEPRISVVGPSGAGKSSFVQAGVIPRLKEHDRWITLRVRPGHKPIEALVSSLILGEDTSLSTPQTQKGSFPPVRYSIPESDNLTSKDLATSIEASPARLGLFLSQLSETRNAKILLFVDQLEELYTLCKDEQSRQVFMEALWLAAGDPYDPFRVIIALRDDSMVKLAETRTTRDSMGRISVLRKPGNAQLEEILIQTVALSGYRYENKDIVEDMIDSVGGELACLPLLQLACMELWERRDKTTMSLTRKSYDEMGGVEGALVTKADGALHKLTPNQVGLARRLFLKLVTPQRTRKVVSRTELLEGLDPDASNVLDRLVNDRALIMHRSENSAHGDVEIALEALIEKWKQLSSWLDESHEERAFLDEVTQAAQLWNRRGRRGEEVWRNEALQDALRRSKRVNHLTSLVTEFLEAGRRLHTSRQRRKRWSLFLTIATLASVAIVLAFQNAQTVKQKNLAEKRLAESLVEGATLALDRNTVAEARAKTRLALEISDSHQARALLFSLNNEPRQWEATLPSGSEGTAAISPSKNEIAASTRNGLLALIDSKTGRVIQSYDGFADLKKIEYSNDGVLIGGLERVGNLRVIQVSNTGSSPDIQAKFSNIKHFAFSPVSPILALLTTNSRLQVYSTKTWKSTLDIPIDTGGRITFSARGDELITADKDGQFYVLDPRSGKRTRTACRMQANILSWKLSKSNEHMLTLDKLNNLQVTNWSTCENLFEHNDAKAVSGWTFLLDETLIATAHDNKTIKLWNIDTGALSGEMTSKSERVRTLQTDKRGSLLVSAAWDGFVERWNPRSALHPIPHRGHGSWITGLSVDHRTGLAATVGYDETLRTWNAKTGEQLGVYYPGIGPLNCVSLSPDRGIVATAGARGTVGLLDTKQGTLRHVITASQKAILDLIYFADGKRLATAGFDGIIRIWNTNDRSLVHAFEPIHQGVVDLAFDPISNRFAAASPSGDITLLDLTTRTTGPTLDTGEGNWCSVAFDVSGNLAAAGSTSGRVFLYSAETLEPKQITTIPGGSRWIDFHPGSRLIGIPGIEGKAWIIDALGQTTLPLTGHANTSEVNHIRFMFDGSTAISAGDDGTLRSWDTSTGNPLWRAPYASGVPLEIATHSGWHVATESGELIRFEPGKSSWRTSVLKHMRTAALSPDGKNLCGLTFDEKVEQWDTTQDTLVHEFSVESPKKVFPLWGGCVMLKQNGYLSLILPGGKIDNLAENVVIAKTSRDDLLFANSESLVILSQNGATKTILLNETEILAITKLYDSNSYAIATPLGIKVLPILSPSDSITIATGNGLRASSITILAEVRKDILISGTREGVVKLFSISENKPLAQIKLHGPVSHFQIEGNNAIAITELGDYAIIDTSLFTRNHCEILSEVWKNTPFIWSNGRTQFAGPPPSHKCQKSLSDDFIK